MPKIQGKCPNPNLEDLYIRNWGQGPRAREPPGSWSGGAVVSEWGGDWGGGWGPLDPHLGRVPHSLN